MIFAFLDCLNKTKGFPCSSGKCIEASKVCDNVDDCKDLRDNGVSSDTRLSYECKSRCKLVVPFTW